MPKVATKKKKNDDPAADAAATDISGSKDFLDKMEQKAKDDPNSCIFC